MSRKQIEFILFYDPQLGEFFSFSEERGILVQETPPKDFQEHYWRDRKVVTYIMDDHLIGKLQNESFRRRPIPTAFLAPRKYRFPIYSTEEPIYESQLEEIKFKQDGTPEHDTHKESIKVKVYLGSIEPQLEPAKRLNPNLNTSFIQSIEIKLITSVNEVLRTVCRTIHQQHKIIITTNSAHSRLILKVRGREEYMYGNEQLSSYLSVLDCLREDKKLEVEIAEEDTNRGREQFHKFIFSRYEDDVKNGVFEGFPWEKLLLQEHCGFLMWYSPDPFYLNLKFIRNEEQEGALVGVKVKIANKLEDRMRTSKLRFPRFLLKENIQVLIEKRREEIEKKIVSLEGETINSGECNYAYYFDLVGMKNAISLLKLSKPEGMTSRRKILKLTGSKEAKESSPVTMLTSQKRYEIGLIAKKNNFCLIPYQFNVTVELYYNGQPIAVSNVEERDTEREDTHMLLFENNPQINQTIQCMPLSQMMMETSVVLKVRVYSAEGKGVVCGVGVIKLFDEYGYLRQGLYEVQLLANQTIDHIKIGCYDHFIQNVEGITSITVRFPTYRHSVRWTLADPKSQLLLGLVYAQEPPPAVEIQKKMTQLTKLLRYDPLKMLKYTSEQKIILRLGKKYYKHQSDKLINYLYSIDWKNSVQIAEAYQALKDWAPLKPIEALFLLTPRLSDEKVRYFAVKCLDQMKNSEFCLYSNQITQALVSFQTHENSLIDLIIQRCCQDPFVVAQQFFWQFWNRTNELITNVRFSLYLELLLLTSPTRFSFFQQVKLNDKLIVSNKRLTSDSEGYSFPMKNEKFKNELQEIEKDLLTIDASGFSFPIRPEMKFLRIMRENSKMYDSKKLPFSLACTSKPRKPEKSNEKGNEKEEHEYKVMFKCGDDIKQDHLILQVLQIFNRLWVEAGMNLKMNIYRVLSTGTEVGFIEIVEKSENSSQIHKEFSQDLMEAFDDKAILSYLASKNKDGGTERMNIVKQNFLRSSAAYLVATYVLGIGDRHSGNYMVQEDGRFFHIDFGHILGNFKKKAGIKRERTPFVFTTEFAHTIGDLKSKQFRRFEDYCCRAYNVLRNHSNMIINLMSMMVGAEIPQLQKHDHLQYLVDKLNLDMSDLQASEHLNKEIKKTLESDFRKYDNWVHEQMRIG